MAEDWMSSRLKLCHLTTGPKTDTVQDPVEVVFNTQSYPQPDYDQDSIVFTLEAYCGALNEARGRKNLCPKSAQTDIIQYFAEMLSRDILNTTVRKREIQSSKVETPLHPEKTAAEWTISNQEKLANRLACEIYNHALEDVVRQIVDKDDISDLHSESCSSMYCCNPEEPDMEVDTKMEANGSTNNHVAQHSDITTYANTLNDMSNMGSLDYPDAPPSTPLLPEMMRSRASFSRKLKGGLAKEFLPSPPPPTPKDQQAEPLSGDMTETAAEKSDFMVRLMRSLSLACSQHGDLEEEQHGTGTEEEIEVQNGISTLSDYAAWLSADIINCITAAQGSTDINSETPARDVQLLANHLAEEIIRMSAAEVTGSKRGDRKRQQNSHMSSSDDKMASSMEASSEETTQAQGDTSLQRSSSHVPYTEAQTALACRIIANTLVQAFSEVERGVLSQQLPSEELVSVSSEGGKVQDLNTTSHCNGKSADTYIMLDSSTETPISEALFAEKIAHQVLECSIQEASSSLLSCNQIIVDSKGINSSAALEQTVLRGLISDELSQDVLELQCVLLWAASSHTGASVLQIDVSDNHIRQQLHSLFLKAQVHGWTVGDLMTCLFQYCEDPQTPSRGHQSNRSLLGHLLLCIG